MLARLTSGWRRLPRPIHVMLALTVAGLCLQLLSDAVAHEWVALACTLIWFVYGTTAGYLTGRAQGGRPLILPDTDPLTANERAQAALFRHLTPAQVHQYVDTSQVTETVDGATYTIAGNGIAGYYSKCLRVRDHRGAALPLADRILTLLLIVRCNAVARAQLAGRHTGNAPVPWHF